MSIRVYGWEQNPMVERFSYRCSDSSAQNTIDSGRGVEIIDGEGRRALMLLPTAPPVLQRLGIGNLISFSRMQDPMRKPERINYPIPALADHRRRWENRFLAGYNAEHGAMSPLHVEAAS